MNVYLAHNYIARDWIKSTVLHLLTAWGFVCTSRWVTEVFAETRLQEALGDLLDIDRAEALVLFADQYGDTPGRGKFIELGYALALGRKCFVVGTSEALEGCVFYKLPQITIVVGETQIDAIRQLVKQLNTYRLAVTP